MKKLLLTLFTVASGQLLAYENVTIRNFTPFIVVAKVEYMACRPDTITVPPYRSAESTGRGACLITKVTGKVQETAQGLEQLGYGAMQSNLTDVQILNKDSYHSSGTGYSSFAIEGPEIVPVSKDYPTGRKYRVIRPVS